jgi:hypothetical protein
VTIACLRIIVLRLLFGFARTLQLLNLSLLRLELSLLRTDLCLGLRVLIVPILHLVAYRVSAEGTDATANSRARQRVTYRSADDRTGCGADTGTDERALLTGRKRLSRASHDHHYRHRHEQTFDYRHNVCPHELSSLHCEQFSCLPGSWNSPIKQQARLLAFVSFLPNAYAINHFERQK